MNTTPEPAGQHRTKQPLSEEAKASLAKTLTLFRIFILTVVGALFIYQRDVSYLWLAALLTAASLALGVVLLVRSARLKESRLVLIGTISGLVVSVVLVLIILVTSVFLDEFREYQACIGRALTDQAQSACRTQLEGTLPTQLP